MGIVAFPATARAHGFLVHPGRPILAKLVTCQRGVSHFSPPPLPVLARGNTALPGTQLLSDYWGVGLHGAARQLCRPAPCSPRQRFAARRRRSFVPPARAGG